MRESGRPIIVNIDAIAPVAEERLKLYLRYLEKVMGREALFALLEEFRVEHRMPGELLFQQEAPVENVWLLLDGRVVEERTHQAGRGKWEWPAWSGVKSGRLPVLGLNDLACRSAHSTSARVSRESTFLVFRSAHITRLLYRFPALNRKMLPRERMSRLSSIPMLAELDVAALSRLASVVQLRRVAAGKSIYGVGQDATTLYLIDRGQVKLEHEDGRVMWLGNGMEFGFGEPSGVGFERAYPLDHSASAVCKTKLFAVSRSRFYAMTGCRPEDEGWNQRRVRSAVVHQPFGVFQQWSSEERAHLLGFMSHYHLPSGHLLVQEHKRADSLWVLFPGKHALLHMSDASRTALREAPIEGPSYFNDAALKGPYSAPGTIEAEAGSIWLRLHWEDYCVYLEQSGHHELLEQLRRAYQRVPVAGKKQRRRFAWLDPDERVVLYTRRHWVELLEKSRVAIVLTLIAGVLWGVHALFGQPLAWWSGLIYGVWALALPSWLWGIVDWANDYLVVTNMRVVHQEKVVFWKNRRYIAPLEQVKQVGTNQSFFGVSLKYANLEIQTSGTSGNLRFDRVPDPMTVRTTIERQRQQRGRSYQAAENMTIYDALAPLWGEIRKLPERVWKQVHLARQADAASRLSFLGVQRPVRSPAQAESTVPASDSSLSTIVWRQHWLVLFRHAGLQTLLMVVFLLLALLASVSDLVWVSSRAAVMLLLLLATFTLMWVTWIIWDWYLDTYVLTATSIKINKRTPWGFNRVESSALLTDVVDIRVEQDNLLQIALNYGAVYLQTAATEGKFSFEYVPDPQSVGEIIRRRRELRQQAIEKERAIQRAKEFPQWLNIYKLLNPGQTPW